MYILYNLYTQDHAALLQAADSGNMVAVKELIDGQVNVNCSNEVS